MLLAALAVADPSVVVANHDDPVDRVRLEQLPGVGLEEAAVQRVRVAGDDVLA